MATKRDDESTTEFTIRCILDEEAEACAKIAERIYGGRAHTYASENADRYRAQDETCAKIADAIRARIVARAKEAG